MTPSPQAPSITPIRPALFPQRPHLRPDTSPDAQRLIGPSPAMDRLWSQIRLLAPHFRVALLTGEPGCGADAVAQALHDLSGFAGTPLVHVRALDADRQLRHPATLFGNTPRATLFLTDIDRLSTASQNVLLRLMKLRRHRRIAIVAFTTVDLRPLVSAGNFSPELFANLSSLRLQIPSMRDRPQDIPLLTHRFLQAESTRLNRSAPHLDASFMPAVTEYTWPGNLDQLRGAIAWMLEHRDNVLTAADLHAAISEVRSEPEAAEVIRMVPLDHVVQEHVRAVLLGCHGNKLRAAEVLGISRSTLYRMLDAAAVPGTSSPLAALLAS